MTPEKAAEILGGDQNLYESGAWNEAIRLAIRALLDTIPEEDRSEAIRKAQSSASSYAAGNLLDARLLEDEARHLLRLHPSALSACESYACQSHACDSFEQDDRDMDADRCGRCGRPSNEHLACPDCGAVEGAIHDTDCCQHAHQP